MDGPISNCIIFSQTVICAHPYLSVCMLIVYDLPRPCVGNGTARKTTLDVSFCHDLKAHDHSWPNINPDYTYTRISTEGALALIDKHFPGRSDMLETFVDIQNPGMKSDFLRYLVLLADGGVYTDTDTTAVRPINEWVPKQYWDRARILVGIEWDIRDEEVQKWFVCPIQFAQLTNAATPYHPILENLVNSVLRSIQLHTAKYTTTVDKFDLSN
ncbi:hypothetical protein PG993_007323 [Apiospora rasikravindrae]|uniref:Initiation-specific alpha-1,6-mannosyltransferase n=1 Tax=Apiospora rasikravindrae TaxID=990691 RepID=A0ABR1SX58_9PEZI